MRTPSAVPSTRGSVRPEPGAASVAGLHGEGVIAAAGVRHARFVELEASGPSVEFVHWSLLPVAAPVVRSPGEANAP